MIISYASIYKNTLDNLITTCNKQPLNQYKSMQERKVVQEEMEKIESKHRTHEKMNHPMTKDQLEEVWEEQDHMDKQV